MSIEEAAPEETAKATGGSEEAAANAQKAGPEPSPAEDEVIQLPAGSLAYDLVRKLRELPYDKQREVMDFVQFHLSRMPTKRPRRSLLGALAHLNIHISSEDIAEARREMWGNFPREFHMSSVVTDTHAALWSIFERGRLTRDAEAANVRRGCAGPKPAR